MSVLKLHCSLATSTTDLFVYVYEFHLASSLSLFRFTTVSGKCLILRMSANASPLPPYRPSSPLYDHTCFKSDLGRKIKGSNFPGGEFLSLMFSKPLILCLNLACVVKWISVLSSRKFTFFLYGVLKMHVFQLVEWSPSDLFIIVS